MPVRCRSRSTIAPPLHPLRSSRDSTKTRGCILGNAGARHATRVSPAATLVVPWISRQSRLPAPPLHARPTRESCGGGDSRESRRDRQRMSHAPAPIRNRGGPRRRLPGARMLGPRRSRNWSPADPRGWPLWHGGCISVRRRVSNAGERFDEGVYGHAPSQSPGISPPFWAPGPDDAWSP